MGAKTESAALGEFDCSSHIAIGEEVPEEHAAFVVGQAARLYTMKALELSIEVLLAARKMV